MPLHIDISCVSGGCGAKLPPGMLRRLLGALPVNNDERLLAGFSGSDDAAVYRLDGELAVVSTADFFPPMVEDPYLFGGIAAANALSDVYAMGGSPVLALNLACFPGKNSGPEIMEAVLMGGADVLLEASVPLGGGHTIYGDGMLYGLAVTGVVKPDRFLRNSACNPGDCLILTKPLGTGLVLSGIRAGVAGENEKKLAFENMRRLNKYAALHMAGYPVCACTDVTGFGLAVHALEMAGDRHTLVIDCDSLPVLPGALEFASEHLTTAAGRRNREYCKSIEVSHLGAAMQELLFDPQTSGGLLISVPERYAQRLCSDICGDEKDRFARIIGQVEPRNGAEVVFL